MLNKPLLIKLKNKIATTFITVKGFLEKLDCLSNNYFIQIDKVDIKLQKLWNWELRFTQPNCSRRLNQMWSEYKASGLTKNIANCEYAVTKVGNIVTRYTQHLQQFEQISRSKEIGSSFILNKEIAQTKFNIGLLQKKRDIQMPNSLLWGKNKHKN